ncbi:MAG: adenosylcobinamide-GDP ribazoletransferase [Spirochaetota bacterium]
MMRIFLAQAAFLSKFPVPFCPEFNEDDLAKGIIFAPAVGILIGLLPAGVFFLLSGAGLLPLAAVMVLF